MDGEPDMRKRKKSKKGLWAVLLVFAAAIAGAGFYFYPAWQAARILSEKMDFSGNSFVIEAELDREGLPQEQERMFGMLEKLTGIPQESLYQLTIKGESQGDRVHMLIYPEGRSEALAEFYLSDDVNVVNETMVYEAIRRHLRDSFPLLGYLMPGQEEAQYMTFEQVEQLFGADLGEMFRPALTTAMRGFTAKQYFLLLAIMSREKPGDGYRFGLEREQMELWFDISGEKGHEAVRMGFSVENPAEAFSQGKELLAKLGLDMEEGAFRSLKSFSVALEPGSGGEITIPDNLANQETIDIISKIRMWIEENINFRSEDSTTI